ncbi:MAG TPA: serine hydrolase [Xanthobacteraceae bacterium]|jgi:D-alanyl-D-alanine carboxypeptidase|nr:serine hydrolase [Xanthobacteraceae bacterium]
MASVEFEARFGLRYCLLASAAVAAALTITGDVADARRHHYSRAHHAHAGHGHRHARVEDYSPPFASIVVDGNSGSVLQAASPDALRHPASLTKVMTLYLLFERLEAGRLKLDSALKISEHASDQAPTKLGLKPGQTISVEDAIKGIVTKSANDAAVAVAENLGGDEDGFAKLMTQKAHALGMSHTIYVNASGLPDDDQVTTARDQTILGRAIQERFPHYYRYFSTESFVYHGEAMRNHNHLLGAVDGVDGIKTGFTRASGFNLLTSLHRDGRYLVAVVMGGPSASERDERMRELISAHIKEAAVRRTAPMIAEASERREEASARSPAARTDRTVTASVEPSLAPSVAPSTASRMAAGSNDPIRPLLVKTISYRTAPVQTASLAPMPALVPVAATAAAPQPSAVAPAVPAQAGTRASSQARTEIAAAAPNVYLKVAQAEPSVPAPAAGEPASLKSVEAPPAQSQPVQMQPAQIEPAPIETHIAAANVQTLPAYSAPPAHAHSGWLIQIGAFDDEDQARQHLSAAQIKVHAPLAAKDPFTERVQKGDKALYRARFAGFDKSTAEAACRALKRSDFECMPLKD